MKIRSSFIGFLLGLTLFCLALSPATSYAQVHFKYIMVVILYDSGIPTQSRIFPMPDAAECKAAKVELETEAKEKGVDVWAACVEVKRPPPLKKQNDS